MLAALNHPHVIPIHGMGEIDGELYIATRLTSSTLRDLIVAGPIAVDDAMTILAASPTRSTPRTPRAWSTATSSPPTS